MATEGLIDEGPKTAEYCSQQCFSIVAPCTHHDQDDCDDSLVELLAIRPAGTGARQLIEKEMPTWDLTALRCNEGHPILIPDPTKAYEHSDTDEDQQ
jgi:hypothetical protein